MRKLILVLFLLSVSAIYAQRTVDLPISSVIDTVDRFTTVYRPSAPTTLYNVTFKTVRDYFWNRANRWIGINTFDSLTVFNDSIKLNNKWYDFPVSYKVNSFLYDSLGNGQLKWKPFDSLMTQIDTLNISDKFIINSLGEIIKWDNVTIQGIPADSIKVLFSNGKWKIPIASADTTINYHWMGLHNFEQDSIKIGGLWYDFPATRIANSVLYDSLGNGILKWKVYPTGGSTIDTTKISYLAKVETFTGAKTFNSDLIFGASADLTLPTADPAPDVGKFWRSTDVLKFTNSSGDVKTLTFGSGTTNELAYWSGTYSLGTLPTASYPSLTEISYVKGVTSAIQTQFTGKLGTGLTNTYIFVGNGSGIATGVAMSGDATIANTGAVTVADDSHAHTGTTISGLAVADFTSPNISNWTNDSGYATQAYVTSGGYTWSGTVSLGTAVKLDASLGYLILPSAGGTNANAFYYDGTNVKFQTFPGNFTLLRDNDSYSNPSWLTSLAESKISFTDITTGNASITAHGFLPKLNNSSTQFLNGQGAWATPASTVDQTAAYNWTGLHTWTKTNIAASTNLTEVTATATNTSTTLDVVAGKFTGTAGHANHTAYGVRAYGVGYLSGGTAVGLYATASTGANNYAGYFDNGMVYIKENLQVGAGKFTISTTGTLIEVNNTLASDVSNYVLMSDGTSYTPVNLLGRDNTYTGSVTYTPEGLTYNTTMDAASKTVISGGGTGNGTTTTLSNGINGQIVILINTSSSYTWTLNETGNINLAGSADYVMGQSDTITLIYESGSSKWLETARSNN